MAVQLLEDCSPYYARFTFEGADRVIERVRAAGYTDNGKRFVHHRYDPVFAQEMLDLIPRSEELHLNVHRFSLLVFKPGLRAYVHKDGRDLNFGINLHIVSRDDACITSWYDDDTVAGFPHVFIPPDRIVTGVSPAVVRPARQLVARQGDVILFNSNIYHEFDNSASPHERWVLTLREREPTRLSFADAYRVLFS